MASTSTDEQLRPMLLEGLQQLQLTPNENQLNKLLGYIALLLKWNQAYNLTAIRNPEEIVTKHILDSLAAVSPIRDKGLKTLADVGSGAGLPGVPLAIMIPDCQLTLIESNGKKAGFLRQVRTELCMTNLEVNESRAEDCNKLYEGVITRAVASIPDQVTMAGHLLKPGAALWCMKGKFPAEELSALPKPYMVSDSLKLLVPGEAGERHLVKIIKQTA